jgi:hypothetical protein
MHNWLSISLAIGLAISMSGCASTAAESSIEGVWQITSIYRDDERPDIPEALPSQFIFTKTRYSIVWHPVATAIKSFATPWQPTDAEKIQRYGEFVVNTGTYEIEGDRLITRPVISKSPGFMGGRQIYGIDWDDDNLIMTLIDEYSVDDVQAPWAITAGGKEHLTLQRVQD